MSSHQIFVRQNRLVLSDGKHELSYSLEEAQSLIEGLEQGVVFLIEQAQNTPQDLVPLQNKLQQAQKRWEPVGNDQNLQTALQLAIDGDSALGIHSLILVFGEESAFDAISRCWDLDDLGWASMKEVLPKELCSGLLGMTAFAPEDHALYDMWHGGSFDHILLPSIEDLHVKDVPESIYERILYILTQEIYLPPRNFLMGQEGPESWDFEGPIHEVELQKPMYAMIFPVTQILYAHAFDENISDEQKYPSHFQGASRPVEQISWLDVIHFCNRLSRQQEFDPCYEIQNDQVVWNQQANGYRLPTEAEWEYLAKDNQEEQKYSGSNDPEEVAWFFKNAENQSHCVGQKYPNTFGMYDMSGNVWEWCWDGYMSRYDAKKQIDPIGSDASLRVLRGGGFESDQESIRVTMRGRFEKDYTWKCLGFRLVRNGEN